MDMKQLRYFTAIAEEGQITSAARRLHIAQPPLSQALKALEAELGVQLFERIPSGIRITEAGALLLQRSYQISNMFDTIAEDMASFRGGREGILKIGTVSSSGSILINENFMAFREHYPKVKFNLYEGNSYQIIEYLEKGIIEIGIVRTPFDNDKFEKICCAPTPMVVAGHKSNFPFSPVQKVTLQQLSKEPILINRRYYRLFQSIGAKENLTFQYYCLNNDARTTLYWTNAGLGMGVVPKETLLIQAYPDLQFSEIDSPELYTQLCAIWVKNKPITQITSNFLAYFGDEQ